MIAAKFWLERFLPNGDEHGVVLIPCDEKHPGECEDYSMIEGVTSQTGALCILMVRQGRRAHVNPVRTRPHDDAALSHYRTANSATRLTKAHPSRQLECGHALGAHPPPAPACELAPSSQSAITLRASRIAAH